MQHKFFHYSSNQRKDVMSRKKTKKQTKAHSFLFNETREKVSFIQTFTTKNNVTYFLPLVEMVYINTLELSHYKLMQCPSLWEALKLFTRTWSNTPTTTQSYFLVWTTGNGCRTIKYTNTIYLNMYMSVIYLNWKKKSVLILDLMIYDTESRSRQTYFSSIVSNHKTFLSSFITHHTPGTSSLLALLPTCLRRDRPFSLFYSFYLSIGGDCVICLCLTPPSRWTILQAL